MKIVKAMLLVLPFLLTTFNVFSADHGSPTYSEYHRAMRLSNEVYNSFREVDKREDLAIFGDVYVGGNQHFGVWYNKELRTAHVSFRGTQKKYLFSNFDFADYQRNIESLSINLTPYGTRKNSRALRGFHRRYQDCNSSVIEILMLTGCKHIEISGHSLGGAVAQLFAFGVASNPALRGKLRSVITFNSPKVGTNELYNEFGDIVNTLRLKNRLVAANFQRVGDPVNILPAIPGATQIIPNVTFKKLSRVNPLKNHGMREWSQVDEKHYQIYVK